MVYRLTQESNRSWISIRINYKLAERIRKTSTCWMTTSTPPRCPPLSCEDSFAFTCPVLTQLLPHTGTPTVDKELSDDINFLYLERGTSLWDLPVPASGRLLLVSHKGADLLQLVLALAICLGAEIQ
ncbi:hypothetical protein KOW79_004021 [Hemibagrus wyckioides]|uniref:Uncharacterized protein n=1 Tax=Hemibagrus wyckioides TaxID=337641 RepID=A0A9D3P0T0_9TELE|nr:hypothetical protein KOW79_004021 [Hemibagrus wyckioides]